MYTKNTFRSKKIYPPSKRKKLYQLKKHTGDAKYIADCHKALTAAEEDMSEILDEAQSLAEKYDVKMEELLQKGYSMHDYPVLPEALGFVGRMEEVATGEDKKVFHLGEISMWHIDGYNWAVFTGGKPLVMSIQSLTELIVMLRLFKIEVDMDDVLKRM